MNDVSTPVKKELSPRAQKAKLGLNKRGQTPEQYREHKKLKAQTKAFAVANGLDWGIKKVPTYFEWNGDMLPSGNFSLVHTRTTESLNTTKDTYRVSQNHHIIRLMLMGVKDFSDELRVVKAGSLHGGRKVYIQLEVIGDGFVKGDKIKRYVTVIDSNDGSSSLSVGIGNLTMSCANQFFYFYKKGDAKFRHSASMVEKMKTIPSLIQYALSASMRMMNLYQKFESTPITRDLAHNMVEAQLGYSLKSKQEDLDELSTRSKNVMESLYKNIYGEMDGDSENGNFAKGENLWGLFSGVTRWTTHHKQAPKRGDEANGRLESVMIGTNYKNNEKALKFALAHINEKF